MQDQYEHHDVSDTSIESEKDSSPAIAWDHSWTRRALWIAGLAVLVGLVGIQVLVTQPLARHLNRVQRDLVRVEHDMSELVGSRKGAWETSDLLTGLRNQADQLESAGSAIETIQDFREQVEGQAAGVEEARSVLGQLVTLQDRLVDEGASHHLALAELNRLVQLRDVAMAGTERTDRAVAEIIRLQQLANGLDHAHESIGQFVVLRDAILAGGTDTDEARVTLDRLVVLQDKLNTHSADVAVAGKNLDKLLTLNDSLNTRSDEIAGAVEALELLTDLHRDIRGHVESLGKMRRDLIEVVLLESTVARVVRMLGPLTELARLRRLSGNEIRAAARSISRQRETNRPTSPRRAIPEPAPGQQVEKTESTRTARPIRDIPTGGQVPEEGTSSADESQRLGIERLVPPPAEAALSDPGQSDQ